MDKKQIIDNCIKAYETEVYEQSNPYEMWIRAYEDGNVKEKSEDGMSKYVLFYNAEGELATNIHEELIAVFDAHPEVKLIYVDEDVIEKGKRVRPWFKGAFSPDTLESTFYFGSVVAVRQEVVQRARDNKHVWQPKEFEGDYPVIRVPLSKDDLSGLASYTDYIRYLVSLLDGEVWHIDKVLYHGFKDEAFTKEIRHRHYDIPDGATASIIIPSKDNPVMLATCIRSIKDKTSTNVDYEIIVVDNGSNEANRTRIEALKKDIEFQYIYEKMEFNFSKMCNRGASVSNGDVLIFMNDDITVQTQDWLDVMCGQALLDRTGAVGAKLYYPDSTVIQHVGITNMGVGPAHKLGGVDDHGRDSIYHGRNLADYNVYAVTAALLAISREHFYEIDGFDSRLAVAYNDVDLCFNLHERGYVNVVRNDVVMWHHESVSRGSDESEEKKARLLTERKTLYTKHPESEGFDPFYSKNLVNYRLDGDYNVGYLYDHEREDKYSYVKVCEIVKDNSMNLMRKLSRKGPAIMGCMDYCKKANSGYELSGWMSLTDEDNCLYKGYVILQGENTYEISTFKRMREDVAAVLTEQKYPLLAGFTARLKKGAVDKGSYEVYLKLVSEIDDRSYVVRCMNGDIPYQIEVE